MAINRDKVLEAAQKYVEKKKYDKAVLEYRKLVDADPNDARTLLKIGDLQQKQGQHAEAISTYETVGKLYSHQGFALKAIAVYKQIREIIAKYVPQLEERYGHITPKLAELYQQLGLTSDALAALDEVATRLQRQQRDQEAIDVFRKIVELDPTNPLPHLRLAEALSRVKDTEGAVFEFKTAASQLAGIGRRDDALKVLERLLHHKPDPEQAKICAELYLSRGQPADGMQALAKLQICFQANPRDFDTLALLARAFNAIGQGAKAIEVQKEMARVAEAAGKTDLFREIVERLLRVAPTDDGVRKLAARSGSAAAAAPPYGGGGANMQQPPAPAPHAFGGGAPPYRAPEPPPPQQPANPYAATQMHMQAPEPPRPATAQMQRPPNAADSYQQPMMHAPEPEPPPSPREGAGVHEISEEEMDELSYEEVDADEVVEAQQQAEQNAYAEGQPYDDAAQYTEPAYSAEEAYAEGNADLGGAVIGSGHPHAHAPAMDDAGVTEPGEAAEVVEKALADANSFRRVRLYTKALETLRIGLEVDPRSMDLHEVYRDILIESGATEEAVQEMLVIASLYVDALDGESAARALQDVLAFDPQNARAIEMLQELGYEIVDESEEAQAEVAPGEEPQAYEEQPSEEQQDHRLPSYDLEEMRPADVGSQYADDRQVYVRGQSQPPGGYAEAEEGALEGGGDALPSFPLDDPSGESQYEQAETYEEAEPY